MKKILVFFIIISPLFTFAQFNADSSRMLIYSSPTPEKFRAHYPNACYMYKTSEDYYNNKPIPDSDWLPWKSSSRINTIKNGKIEEKKISEIGVDWFSDANGILMRRVEKTLYRVIVDGPVCYFVEFGNGEALKNPDGTFDFATSMFSGKYFEYYSMTLNGEIESWSDKILEKYLKEYGWLEQYKAEKIPREMKDSVWDVESRKINKKLKYLKMVNEKLAKK